MTKNIELAMDYLRTAFDDSLYFQSRPEEKEYRLRHSIRVANIGAEIAKQENMDVEAMTIACLLHDLSYKDEFKSEEDWKNHGRVAAETVRAFLKQIPMDDELKQEICFGIAIHVDDQADFEGTRTAFAQTVGDSDNIDRFDVYRIYDNLQYSNFSGLSHDEQLSHVTKKLVRLEELKSLEFGSKTATTMWLERLDYQIDFFKKLNEQLDNGERVKAIF